MTEMRDNGVAPVKALDLDDVLVNEPGQFGRYQIYCLLLAVFPMVMSAFMFEYIFSAFAIPYRCAIPECDGDSPVVQPDWIGAAVPETSNGWSSCQRFALAVAGNASTPDVCPASLFDRSSRINCDGYIYGKTNSVVYTIVICINNYVFPQFGLECQEWLRALAGTLSGVGNLIVLPMAGYVSDRWGRRVALIVSMINLTVVGLVRAFSTSYPMYLALQMLQTLLGAGTYSSSYIFATELVGRNYRVLASAIVSSMFSVGQVVLGAVAWLVQPWRYMIIALHVPGFLIISYYWFFPESVRWLLSKGKFEEARRMLVKIAKTNGTDISDKSLNALTNPPAPTEKESASASEGLVHKILRSSVMRRRVLTTPIWWMTSTFVYYGLSINATGLSGNMYLNYILICAIEIPGSFSAVLVLDRMGRRPTLATSYLICAACNIAFSFISNDAATLRLVLFLVGKFCISFAFPSAYLFTAELYPTQHRHSLLAFSSMIGRIGAMTAPLTPALMEYWTGLPTMLFGAMGLLSCALVLTQPETLGTRMPDTMAEAEALGRAPTPNKYS